VERVIVGGVNVRVGCGYSDFDFILVLPCLDDTEICADFVVTLCAPRNVMYVGEGIHVQNVGVSGCDQKILEEGSDHMPRFKED